jgi:hypothetical protein
MERIAFVKPCHLQKPDQPEPAAEEQRIPAQIRDISLGGMVLVAGQRFESGTLLKIEVPGPNGQPSLNLLARVIQVTVQSQRAFVLSCCFAKELNEEDLRVFGAECVRAKEDDGRTWMPSSNESKARSSTSPQAALPCRRSGGSSPERS